MKVHDRYLPEKYRRSAALARYCSICGDAAHPKRNCPILAQLRESGGSEDQIRCDYPLCKLRGHKIRICPALHALCTCGCRGHAPDRCHEFTTADKHQAYEQHRAVGAALIPHLEDSDWDFGGPAIPKENLVPVYTDYGGFYFVEGSKLQPIMEAANSQELKTRIIYAHFH